MAVTGTGCLQEGRRARLVEFGVMVAQQCRPEPMALVLGMDREEREVVVPMLTGVVYMHRPVQLDEPSVELAGDRLQPGVVVADGRLPATGNGVPDGHRWCVV